VKFDCQNLTAAIQKLQKAGDDFDNIHIGGLAKLKQIFEQKMLIKHAVEETVSLATLTETEAQKILGNDFIGSEELELIFPGVLKMPENIPKIWFTEAELKRAKELGQFLVLRVDKFSDGKPMTIDNMITHFVPNLRRHQKFTHEPHEKVNPEMYRKEKLPLSWALVSKKLILATREKNYWQETQALAQYLVIHVYDGKLPAKYEAALSEYAQYQKDNFHALRDGEIYQKIFTNWPKYAKEISNLQINQLFRATPAELAYNLLVYFQYNEEKLLRDHLASTTRLTAQQSDHRDNDQPILFGLFSNSGYYARSMPKYHTSEDWGVVFSRRK
jgi:hypothetical protein